jgi:nucleoside-diphosphate kinase
MKPESIEKTFVMIKPDGVKRGLVGKIFSRFEQVGLKLVACRMIQPTEEMALGNYPKDNMEWLIKMGEKTHVNYGNNLEEIQKDMGTIDKLEIGKKILDSLVKYISSGPVILMVWEGNHATSVIRKLAGATDPTKAELGSIRGDFGFDTPMLAVKSGRIVFQTIVHISENQEEAKREIEHWFGDKYKDLGNYTRIDYTGSYEAFN